jgi:hypothetical protein
MTWNERIAFVFVVVATAVILTALVVTACHSEPALSVTVKLASNQARIGQVVPVTVTLANTATPRPPLVIDASVSWVDSTGAEQTATDSVSLAVIQPLTVNNYRIQIPAGASYAAGSATVAGLPVIPTYWLGGLTLDVKQTLNEGQSVTLGYAVRVE